MESSRRINRVSVQQLEILWEFLVANRDIASAFNRSLQAKEYARRKWIELAEILNSQGDGTHKDWKGWSKYWVDYKAKLKARATAVRASLGRTGGGPSTDKPLTEVEIKFLQILGEDFGEGLPGVRVEPFPERQQITSASVVMDVQDSPASESILQNFVQNIPILPIHSIPTDPSPEILPQTPRLSQSPSRTPTRSIQPPAPPIAHSPRRRRHRREPPMTQEATRRALIHTTKMYAEAAIRTSEAAVRTAEALEKIAETMEKIAETMVQLQSAVAGREH